MTDVPARQDSPENDEGRSSSEDAQGTQSQTQQGRATQTQDGQPQWAVEQPAPAPWFLGRPGPVPQHFPPPPGWTQAPPTQQQPSVAPPDADQQHSGQGGQTGRPGQPADRVPPWSGQLPPNPEHPNGAGQSGPGPNPEQQPAPWLDPNRYAQPGSRPPAHDPRSGYRPPQPPQQQPRREEPGPGTRPPLSLRTRWARGLALGGALCTLMTLLNGYQNFPAWLIGAIVALLMSLGGLWLGAFAQRDAVRRSQRAPEAVASVVWAGISTLIAVAIVAFSLIFYPQLRDYSDCMHKANTISGQNACQQQFNHSMTFKP